MASKLSNADFSKLLNQADEELLRELTARPKKKAKAAVEDAAARRQKFKEKHLQQIRRQKRREDAQSRRSENQSHDSTQGWRDRAAERRTQTEEFQRVAAEFEDLQKRSEEESKYLGGDLEHTHLVKGLDYVLLQKVRAEILAGKAADVAAPDPSADSKTPLQNAEGKTKSLMAARIARIFRETLHPHSARYKMHLERIHQVVLRGATFRAGARMFQPGKMQYQYPSFDAPISPPVVIIQSCPAHAQTDAS